MDMLVGEIRVCRPLHLIYLTHAITKTCTKGLHYIILCGPQFKHAALTDAQHPLKQAKHLKRVIGNAQVRGVGKRHEKRKMQVSEKAYIDATEEVPAS
ncbi:unnamed protein product [Sphenostylis stenocarpa]|uniref:Uncharacterized protein n=1 Tax=Sphenostylis stenocarpa TaxID=92480 RepID=A0AA86VCD1_9FABA|nr:unnamed protein product [Sphenostylis stenocarpa]